MAIRAVSSPLPLVAALLDVSDSSDSLCSLLRRPNFLLEGVLTGRTARDDQGTCDRRIPMGDRRKVRRTVATTGHLLGWLPWECIGRSRRLDPAMQMSV